MSKYSKWISAVLILCSAIFSLIIVQHIPIQLDFSSEKNYTLSKGSKTLLKKIEEPINLDFYYSRSIDGIPNAFKNFANRIEVFLKQYERHSNGMVHLKIIDPKPDTKEEEQAIRSGIRNTDLPNGESLFLGLVATQADQEESIDLFSQQRESFLEYDISQLIAKVQTLDKSKIGIITSLPIEGSQQPQIPGMPAQGGQPEWIFLSQLKEQFDVTVIEPTADEIDNAFDLLFVIHPKALSKQLSFSIDQFLLAGKPVVLALDPSSVVERQNQNPQMAMMGRGGPTHSDLPDLLNAWGIEFDASSVVGDLEYAARVSGGMGQATPYPVWQMTDNLNSEIPVVATLNQLLLVEGGAFELREDSKLELLPLVETSLSSTTTPAMMLMYSQPSQVLSQIQQQIQNTGGEILTTAGIISGEFQTAFPDGKPSDETEASEDTDQSLKSGNGKLLLIADTDFLYDQFSVERMNFLGSSMLRPLNDNLNFVLNITEFFTGNEDLLSLRGRGTATRPFKKIQQLEIQAQARFQSELDAVNAQLNEVQSQLSEIQSQQSSNGILVASPELQEAIENFQQEQANAVAKRRDIRKRLREDIEALDRNLAMFNLLFVPAILTVFGIRFFMIRNRRKR